MDHVKSWKMMFMKKNHLVSILLGNKKSKKMSDLEKRKQTKKQIFTQ